VLRGVKYDGKKLHVFELVPFRGKKKMFQATPTTSDLDTFKDAAIILVGS